MVPERQQSWHRWWCHIIELEDELSRVRVDLDHALTKAETPTDKLEQVKAIVNRT